MYPVKSFPCLGARSQASPLVKHCGLGGFPHEQMLKGFPDLKELAFVQNTELDKPRTRSWACPQNTELGKQIGALDKRRKPPRGRTALTFPLYWWAFPRTLTTTTACKLDRF